METTYTILGADGLQYGPINLGQLKIWIREGRITPETQVLRSDNNVWLAAVQYVELEMAAAPAPIVGSPPSRGIAKNPVLERQVRSGARWFFWIGGLSLINTLIAMSGRGLVFIVGLGMTQIIDGFAKGM